MTLPIAHAGHYLLGLLYMAPVIVLGAALVWQRRRDARTARDRHAAADAPGTDRDAL